MHVNSINKNWFNDKRGWNVLKRFIYVNIKIYEYLKNIQSPFVNEPIFVNAIYMHIKVKNFT